MVRAQSPHRHLQDEDRRAEASGAAPVASPGAQVVASENGSPEQEQEQQTLEDELSAPGAGDAPDRCEGLVHGPIHWKLTGRPL